MGPMTLTRSRRSREKRVERRIPPSEWEPLKTEIDELYQGQGWTQDEVVVYLNSKREFRVRLVEYDVLGV